MQRVIPAGDPHPPLFLLIVVGFWMLGSVDPLLWAEDGPALRPLPVAPPSPPSQPEPPPLGGSTPLEILVRETIVELVPHIFVDETAWNRDTERFDGFRIRGLRIEERKKRVNHGFWQRYQVQLIQPDENLRITIRQLDGAPEKRVRFDVSTALRARIEVTYAFWTYGVKGLNGTTVADATIHTRLRLSVAPRARFEHGSWLPSLAIEPRVDAVWLRLKDLDVRRIGVIGPAVAEPLGDGSRKAIEAFMQSQSGRLKQKLQARLDRMDTAAEALQPAIEASN